jgi:hypothetical protein
VMQQRCEPYTLALTFPLWARGKGTPPATASNGLIALRRAARRRHDRSSDNWARTAFDVGLVASSVLAPAF